MDSADVLSWTWQHCTSHTYRRFIYWWEIAFSTELVLPLACLGRLSVGAQGKLGVIIISVWVRVNVDRFTHRIAHSDTVGHLFEAGHASACAQASGVIVLCLSFWCICSSSSRDFNATLWTIYVFIMSRGLIIHLCGWCCNPLRLGVHMKK